MDTTPNTSIVQQPNAQPVQRQAATTVQELDFPSISRRAREIAYAYNIVGLYSIPVLTLATVISITNVFTSGMFANIPFITTSWALIFAVAIDVNIVRMFVEGYVEWKHHRRVESVIAYIIGLGLGSVTGVALFFEGIEQSIGLSWQSIHNIIAVLIAARVVFVVVLMAREGIKLGSLVLKVAQIANAPVQKRVAPKATGERPPVQLSNTPEQPSVQKTEQPANSAKVVSFAESEHLYTRSLELVAANPNISARALAKELQLKSPSSGNKYLSYAKQKLAKVANS